MCQDNHCSDRSNFAIVTWAVVVGINCHAKARFLVLLYYLMCVLMIWLTLFADVVLWFYFSRSSFWFALLRCYYCELPLTRWAPVWFASGPFPIKNCSTPASSLSSVVFALARLNQAESVPRPLPSAFYVALNYCYKLFLLASSASSVSSSASRCFPLYITLFYPLSWCNHTFWSTWAP